MSTEFATVKSRWLQLVSMVVAMLAISVSTDGLAATDGGTSGDTSSEKRVSISSHIPTGGRQGNADGGSSQDEYDPILSGGERVKQSGSQRSAKSGGTQSAAQSSSFDFWIYDADVLLFSDDDRDGFFYGIDLLFDADTIYSVADVYAVLYLSLEGGPWNEYAVTEEFSIFGESASDEYVMITELMSGYPTGDYDILIELFDAVDDSFLASFGPEDTAELEFLPLEDFNRDAPVVTEVTVAVSHGNGGGGTASLILLLALLAIILRRSFPIRKA